MAPRYSVGQKVIITPVVSPHSATDSDLAPYAGQIGEITEYHWISPSRAAGTIYVYTVRLGESHRKIVLHEDEVAAYEG
jgi:hypothetical protein